jgi:tricorn protease-like protein
MLKLSYFLRRTLLCGALTAFLWTHWHEMPAVSAQNGRGATDGERARAVRLVKRASVAFDAGRFDEAIILCRQATQADPNYVRAYTWLGASSQKKQAKAEACNAFRKVLLLAPNSPDAARAQRGLRELGCPAVVKAPSRSTKSPRVASGARPDRAGERVYDVSSNLERILKGHSQGVRSVGFAADGQTVASGSADQTVRLWNVETGESKAILRGHSDEVTSVAFAPKANSAATLLATASYDNTVRVWELPSGNTIRVLQGDGTDINTVAFSPDGNTIAGGAGRDGKIWLWEVATGQVVRILRGHTQSVLSVAFSRDGQWLVSAGMDGTVRLWNATTGEAGKVFSRGTPAVVSISPDARLVAIGGGNTVQLRDIETNAARHMLSGHTSGVVSLAFSPDGNTLASGSYDTTVRLWNVQTGKLRWKLKGHGSIARTVAFSPDGLTLATGSQDNTVNLWRIHPDALANVAKR